MSFCIITHPTATVSRGIENMVIAGDNSKNFLIRGGCAVTSRLVSLTVFPIFLLLELIFKRVPKLLLCIGNRDRFNKKLNKIIKYALAFPFFPLGIHSPESISGFFLRFPATSSVLPFGVEKQFGKQVDHIFYPKGVRELQEIILRAKKDKKQVSIIGAGMSQGIQTIPGDSKQVVINTKYLNQMQLSEDGKTATVGAGATWEQLQIYFNSQGKSARVKQASDLFSIGGSIGINCHGWAHEDGAISSTVESLEIIDANGEFKTITPKDELFGCMFGTLGYFGLVVSATLKVADNEYLIEKTDEIDLDQFSQYYKTKIKGKNISLFGGRLVLDSLDGTPLRKVCMVRYEKDEEANREHLEKVTENFLLEPTLGTRMERIGLKLIAHLSNFSVRRLISWFWKKERESMFKERHLTRNEALHPPINAFKMLHNSNLHTQWLQEYFVTEKNLPNFLRFLGAELKANDVRLINATIRPTPKDTISILPYAEQDRHAVVISFSQVKTEKEIARTRSWIERVNQYLVDQGDVYYQAYMPYATREQFEKSYGKGRVNRLRKLKEKYDAGHLFGNAHTAKYFDK